MDTAIVHVYQSHMMFPSPDDCILDVVLMESPNRQYRGILDPTTPATIFPVCTPARIVIVLGAISGLTILPHAALRSSAILQISQACMSPFFFGTPETTRYWSDIVSTL